MRRAPHPGVDVACVPVRQVRGEASVSTACRCDRCKEFYEPANGTAEVEFARIQDVVGTTATSNVSKFDLCTSCSIAVYNLLANHKL